VNEVTTFSKSKKAIVSMATLTKHLGYIEIIQYFREKKIDRSWSFDGFKPSDAGKWTHCYHRYPAKFIPQVVEALIQEYIESESAHINDPFMGSGTTIVTGISKGFKSSGTDINKLAYLMAKVKSTPIEPKNELKKYIEDAKGLYSINCYTYSVKNDKLIFNLLED